MLRIAHVHTCVSFSTVSLGCRAAVARPREKAGKARGRLPTHTYIYANINKHIKTRDNAKIA